MSKRPVRRFLARVFLAVTGWKPAGLRPAPSQYVLIAAPHTSNWDFPYLLAFAWYFEIELSWMGKHTLFAPPFGFVMRWFGGLPVRRDKSHNLVEAMAGLFDEHPQLALAVPAEGTRDHVDYWKSGFYHIAREAGVPIVMSFLDYAGKRGGFGPAFQPSGDVRKDMQLVRAFYADKQGKYPERFGTVRLREEDEGSEEVAAITASAAAEG